MENDKNWFLLNMNETEQQIAVLQTKQGEDLQLIATNSKNSIIVINNSMIQNANLIIGYVSPLGTICLGKMGKAQFSYPVEGSHHGQWVRVFLDSRKPENIKFHVSLNGTYRRLKNSNENSNEKLIVYIEHPDFVQFSLYDGHLSQKVSHIFTASIHLRLRIRTIARSLLNQSFEGLDGHLAKMEEMAIVEMGGR